VVIRDHRGQIVLAGWKFIPSCSSSEEAEILACLEGLQHLITLRRWPAILESDCLRVVQALTSEEVESSPCWAVIHEARELLKIFRGITVLKVDRVSNGVAHVLAQVGKSGGSDILCNSVSDCVRDLVFLDCRNTL
jgi:ribonuclease HI